MCLAVRDIAMWQGLDIIQLCIEFYCEAFQVLRQYCSACQQHAMLTHPWSTVEQLFFNVRPELFLLPGHCLIFVACCTNYFYGGAEESLGT